MVELPSLTTMQLGRGRDAGHGVVDGVVGEAAVEVVVEYIAVEQRRLELALEHGRLVFASGHVLVRIQDAAIIEHALVRLVLELNRVQYDVRVDELGQANLVQQLVQLHQRQADFANQLRLGLGALIQLVPLSHQTEYVEFGRTKRVALDHTGQTVAGQVQQRVLSEKFETIFVDEAETVEAQRAQLIQRGYFVNRAHILHVQNRLQIVGHRFLQIDKTVLMRQTQQVDEQLFFFVFQVHFCLVDVLEEETKGAGLGLFDLDAAAVRFAHAAREEKSAEVLGAGGQHYFVRVELDAVHY
ncbi:hypothetical protein BpHYR1_048790 [Brachionus plicatilis]|uniref:Uncharacterized protein n=1 Tax=Brachionus plicatilis TaxID=10195 RepID=A0A3M7QFU0_BRAPC|nr:hypothetical protein BpHYR1_048790 [Brachionus plicatilis]